MQNTNLDNAKALGIFTGIFLVVYFLFFRNNPKKIQAQVLQQAIDSTQQLGYKESFPDIAYMNFADRLYQAMRYSGTDEKTIYNVFDQMKNDLDVLKLTQAYGVRQLYVFGLPDGNPKNLAESLASELSAREISSLNAILRKNQIKISF